MRLLFTSLVIAFISVGVCRADIVFQDSFSTNGALVTSLPQVGAAWAQTGTSATNPIQVSGGRVQISNTGQDAWGGFSSQVATTPGDSIYVGLDINVTSASAGGDYFLHFSDPAGTTTNFYNRIFLRAATGGFQIGIASNSGTGTVTTYGATALNFGQNYRIVSAWDFVSGTGNDVLNLYVDPVSGDRSSNTAYISNYSWTGTGEPTAFVSAVNLRQGGTTSFPVLSGDNLIVSKNNFAEAAAVPEPTCVSLLGMAGIAMLAVRRQKA